MRKTARLARAISAWVSASRLIAPGGGSRAGAGPGSATGVGTDVGAGVAAAAGSATGVGTDAGAGSGVGAGSIIVQADSRQAAARQRAAALITIDLLCGHSPFRKVARTSVEYSLGVPVDDPKP